MVLVPGLGLGSGLGLGLGLGFTVLVPGMSGLPTNISAMMQPTAHMSTALV